MVTILDQVTVTRPDGSEVTIYLKDLGVGAYRFQVITSLGGSGKSRHRSTAYAKFLDTKRYFETT